MNALAIIDPAAAQEIDQLIEASEGFDHDREAWTAKGAMVALGDLPAGSDVSRALAAIEHALSMPASPETLSDLLEDMLETQCVSDAATQKYRALLTSELGTFPEVVVRLAIRDVLLTFDHAGKPVAFAVVLGACERQGRRLRHERRKLNQINGTIKRLQTIAGGGEDPDECPF
jgi:hypothetical protein